MSLPAPTAAGTASNLYVVGSGDGSIVVGYGAPGNRLYVNRGIGFSMVPIRINCRPEVTLFELRREATNAPPPAPRR